MAQLSFIVPAYNAQAYIEHTLRSLQSQTIRDLEILVVDDGSTDATPAIVERYAAKDGRIRLLRQANAGVAAARNHGLRFAHGRFLAPVDADDIWDPSAAEKMIQRLEQVGPTAGVAYAWSFYIDQHGRPVGGYRAATIEGWVASTLVCHFFIGNASATVIRREAWEKAGAYDEGLRQAGVQGCEDWDFYLRLADHYQFVVVPEFLIGYRKPPESMSSQSDRMRGSQQRVLDKWYAIHPGASRKLRQISVSSFCHYLSQEARRRGDLKETRRWAKEAFQAAPLLTAIRPGWYVSRFLGRPENPPAEKSNITQAQKMPLDGATANRPLPLTLIGRLRLRGVLLAQQAFHQTVKTFFGRCALPPTKK